VIYLTLQPTAGCPAQPGFSPRADLAGPLGLLAISNNGVLEASLPTAGAYEVRVHDDDCVQTGCYAFSSHFVDAGSSCGAPIACGQTLQGDLSQFGFSDSFTYAASGRGRIRIAIGIVSITDAGFLPCFAVYDPSGALRGADCNSPATVDLPGPGVYTILVYDSQLDHRGQYSLTLEGVSESLRCATPVACGQDNVTGVLSTSGDLDSFRFVASSAGWLSVSTEAIAPTAGFNPCWEVFAPSGTALSGGPTCGRWRVQLPAMGPYTIEVRDDDLTEGGTYLLSVQGLSESLACNLMTVQCGQDFATDSINAPGDTDAFQ
jgi:hypothetical protein